MNRINKISAHSENATTLRSFSEGGVIFCWKLWLNNVVYDLWSRVDTDWC